MTWPCLIVVAYLTVGVICARAMRNKENDDPHDVLFIFMWPLALTVVVFFAAINALHWLITTPLPNPRTIRARKQQRAQARIEELETELYGQGKIQP